MKDDFQDISARIYIKGTFHFQLKVWIISFGKEFCAAEMWRKGKDHIWYNDNGSQAHQLLLCHHII